MPSTTTHALRVPRARGRPGRAELGNDSEQAAGLRQAFAGFDPARSPGSRRSARRLLADPGIVRNRLKIASTIANARALLAVQDELGSLDRFSGVRRRRAAVNRWRSMPGAGPDGRVGRDEPGAAEARLQLRRLDDLLRVHAGRRHGRRPHARLLQTTLSIIRSSTWPSFPPSSTGSRVPADLRAGVVERAARCASSAVHVLLVCDAGIVPPATPTGAATSKGAASA